MSVSTRNPLRMLGGATSGGGPNTGQVPWTNGGAQVATVWSGGVLSPGSGFPVPVAKTGDQIMLFSGAGRLDQVIPHQAISGVALVFYDAGSVAVSGPLVGGAVRVLGIVPANSIGSFGNALGGGPLPMQFGTPFTSGLCVAATSGTPGFTVSFTPEMAAANA